MPPEVSFAHQQSWQVSFLTRPGRLCLNAIRIVRVQHFTTKKTPMKHDHPSGKSISRYQKLFGVGPIAGSISLCLLALLWLLDRRLGHIPILSQPLSIHVLGLILIGLEICWHIWCMKTIRRWWFGNQLCTTGPYQFVRHPIYAGGLFLGFLGLALLLNSWITLLCPLIQYPILSILVRREEKMMTAIFGEEYQRYAAKTGRLLPRLYK